MVDAILDVGGIDRWMYQTPTMLWDSLYDGGINLEVGPYGISPTSVTPDTGSLYGGDIANHSNAMRQLIDRAAQEEEEAERKPHDTRGQSQGSH